MLVNLHVKGEKKNFSLSPNDCGNVNFISRTFSAYVSTHFCSITNTFISLSHPIAHPIPLPLSFNLFLSLYLFIYLSIYNVYNMYILAAFLR